MEKRATGWKGGCAVNHRCVAEGGRREEKAWLYTASSSHAGPASPFDVQKKDHRMRNGNDCESEKALRAQAVCTAPYPIAANPNLFLLSPTNPTQFRLLPIIVFLTLSSPHPSRSCSLSSSSSIVHIQTNSSRSFALHCLLLAICQPSFLDPD
jgi:hypothetical protein